MKPSTSKTELPSSIPLRKVISGGSYIQLLSYRPLAVALLALAASVPAARAQPIYSAPYAFTNYAGVPGVSGANDGNRGSALFNGLGGVALDKAGSLYVADDDNCTIRKIDAVGNVTTVAGTYGVTGSADGSGTNAQFYYPSGVAVDSKGNIYVADEYNHVIRKIDTNANVTTLAGSAGEIGSSDGNGSSALFQYPTEVAVDSADNLYVADYFNCTIRKIDTNANVTTLAGSAGVVGAADGNGSAALFNYPYGVAVDSAGNVYVTDQSSDTIRKIDTHANVTTVAGSGLAGSMDGPGGVAQFNQPGGLAVDRAGNVYVADTGNATIRKVDTNGYVTTLAGSQGATGPDDGPGMAALFNQPYGMAVDGAGNVYVGDYGNDRISIGALAPPAVLSINWLVAPYAFTNLAGQHGVTGANDGNGGNAQFHSPAGVAVDSATNIYVVDQYNHAIRKIDPAGNVTTLAGSPGVTGSADGNGANAQFYYPAGGAVDSAGNIYVADEYNHSIRKIDTSANVTTLAGTGLAGSADGNGANAQFYYPAGVAVDSAGNVYVADFYNQTIRKIDTSSNVTTFAGATGVKGTNDGNGANAQFHYPYDVAVDSAGNVYVADLYSHTIRKIDTNANVTTLAGTPGVPGRANGHAGAAQFHYPEGVAVDNAGNVYVGDYGNSTIRKIDTNANVTTLAGGRQGFADGIAGTAEFYYPTRLAVDSAHHVYVSDSGNNRISKGTVSQNVLAVTSLSGVPLQWSTNVAGPWVNIPGSGSPFIVTPTGPQNFYRGR